MLSLITIIGDLYINPTLKERGYVPAKFKSGGGRFRQVARACLRVGGSVVLVGPRWRRIKCSPNSLSFAKVLIVHPDLERRWSIGNEPWLPWRGKRLPNTCAISVALPTKVIGPSKSIAFCCMPLGLF